MAAIRSIDTLGVVVIYAYSTATGLTGPGMGDTLPGWWSEAWDRGDPRSIQAYWRDVSYGKHGMEVGVPVREVGPGDPQLAWVSDYSSYGAEGDDFCQDIFAQVDAVFDFSPYDLTGSSGVPDGYVDIVIFIVVNDSRGNGQGFSGLYAGYVTQDGVTISEGTTQWVYSEYWARRIICHEYGHKFGLGDLESWPPDYVPPIDYTRYSHGLGSFCVMCAGGSRTGFFTDMHPSPLDPRHQEYLGWLTPAVVDRPLYGQTIKDRMTWGETYKLVSPVDANQYFLVSNEKHNVSYWQNNWPEDAGAMIWHVNRAASGTPQNKQVDIEVSSGRFVWTYDPLDVRWEMTDEPNAAGGRDSLDVWGAYDVMASQGGVGSKNAYFYEGTKTAFEGPEVPGANPTSAFHVSGTDTNQSARSYTAVKNVVTQSPDMVANLYAYSLYGHISQSTIWGSGSFYVPEDAVVENGATLTIAAGTTLTFTNGANLIVQSGGVLSISPGVWLDFQGGTLIVNTGGTCTAVGNSQLPIRLFSSTVPSTHQENWTGPCNEAWGVTTPYGWQGIRALPVSQIVLQYCRIEDAFIGLRLEGPTPVGTAIGRCVFTENAFGLLFKDAGVVGLGNCSIASNGECGLYSDDCTPVLAKSCVTNSKVGV